MDPRLPSSRDDVSYYTSTENKRLAYEESGLYDHFTPLFQAFPETGRTPRLLLTGRNIKGTLLHADALMGARTQPGEIIVAERSAREASCIEKQLYPVAGWHYGMAPDQMRVERKDAFDAAEELAPRARMMLLDTCSALTPVAGRKLARTIEKLASRKEPFFVELVVSWRAEGGLPALEERMTRLVRLAAERGFSGLVHRFRYFTTFAAEGAGTTAGMYYTALFAFPDERPRLLDTRLASPAHLPAPCRVLFAQDPAPFFRTGGDASYYSARWLAH